MDQELERRRLLERVQEQEKVIRRLCDRYERDAKRELDIGDFADIGSARHVPAAAAIVRNVLHREETFDDAIEKFEFHYTHVYAEASVQRNAARLMHSRPPAVIAKRTGDLILKGFWGRGVSITSFENLLQKVRALPFGAMRRLDLSDNGLNGNFVPPIIEMIRRGTRQLILSQNNIESPAMQQLCAALPHLSQCLEALNMRSNPCDSDSGFFRCLSDLLPAMQFLYYLSVSVRCENSGESAAAAPIKSNQHLQRTPTPTQSRGVRSSSTTSLRASVVAGNRIPRSRPKSVDANSKRSHRRFDPASSASNDLAPPAEVIADVKAFQISGKDAAVAFFRSVSQCQQLCMLDLRASSLSALAVQRLSHFLRNDQLVTLSLAECFLGSDAEPLLAAVATCRKLSYLSLRMNAMKGHTGLELCRVLEASVSLTEVDVASNWLSDDFGQAFASVLVSNEVLWKTNLVRNPFGIQTGEALMKVLQRGLNSTLISIGDMEDNFFSLGLTNRLLIQRHLDANRRAVDGESPRDAMNLCLVDFEWEVLDDEFPQLEPLLGLM